MRPKQRLEDLDGEHVQRAAAMLRQFCGLDALDRAKRLEAANERSAFARRVREAVEGIGGSPEPTG